MEEQSLQQIDFKIDWSEIAEGLTDFDQQLLPFLAFGVPYSQIADFFDVDKSTITKRFTYDKHLGPAVAHARKIVKWELHRIWLNQKAVKAWENLDWFLSIDPFEKNEDDKFVHDSQMRKSLMSEKAKMTRFTLEQLGLRIQRVEVEHNTPRPMFDGDASAAQVVIEAINRLKDEGFKSPDVIAAEYKVISGVEITSEEPVRMKPSEEEREIKEPWDRRPPKQRYE